MFILLVLTHLTSYLRHNKDGGFQFQNVNFLNVIFGNKYILSLNELPIMKKQVRTTVAHRGHATFFLSRDKIKISRDKWKLSREEWKIIAR